MTLESGLQKPCNCCEANTGITFAIPISPIGYCIVYSENFRRGTVVLVAIWESFRYTGKC